MNNIQSILDEGRIARVIGEQIMKWQWVDRVFQRGGPYSLPTRFITNPIEHSLPADHMGQPTTISYMEGFNPTRDGNHLFLVIEQAQRDGKYLQFSLDVNGTIAQVMDDNLIITGRVIKKDAKIACCLAILKAYGIYDDFVWKASSPVESKATS